MSYVNFKEEKFKAKNQLENRVKNNKKLFDEIRKSQTLPSLYVPDLKYSFKDFENRTLGGGHIKEEENFEEVINKDIVCTRFKACKFYNIKFKDCKFIGCYFIDCDFGSGGVSFENCTFYKQESEVLPSLNRDDNFSCEFNKCNIYCKFLNCSLNYAIFDRCMIKNTTFQITEMSSVIIVNSNMKKAILMDVDITGSKFIDTYTEDLEFRDKYLSKMDEKTFVDKIKFKKNTRDEYEGIYMVYETWANKFEENKLKNNFGEYYFLCKKTQFKTLKPIPKFLSFLNWVSCGYGERPLYALYTSLFIMLIFTIIYLMVGMDIEGEIIRYGIYTNNFEFIKFIKDCNEALNLSVGMFAGIGIDRARPTPSAYMFSNIEMIVGVVMMAVGSGALTKKLVR